MSEVERLGAPVRDKSAQATREVSHVVVVAGGACGSSVLQVPSLDFDLEVSPCFNYTPAVDLSPSLYWEYAVRSTAITITVSNAEVC